MILQFSIKFTDKDEKLLGIETDFFLDILEALRKRIRAYSWWDVLR
jgi:hypothetical protein